MNINQMSQEAYSNSYDHGFWDLDDKRTPLIRCIPEKLILIVSEVAEALESYRSNPESIRNLSLVRSHDPNVPKGVYKPIGFPSELADIVIRVGDMAKALDIDLESVIEAKMMYNKYRGHKHGKSI